MGANGATGEVTLAVDKGIAWPVPACCMAGEPGWTCECGVMERALNGWIRGELPPMNSDQRAACLSEIGAIEGYRAVDHCDEPDAQLARTVISAWMDYCRDKGLL